MEPVQEPGRLLVCRASFDGTQERVNRRRAGADGQSWRGEWRNFSKILSVAWCGEMKLWENRQELRLDLDRVANC
ncbi:MAG: hypothetical protein R3C01_06320 [Planctomycetaceae bacterium]